MNNFNEQVVISPRNAMKSLEGSPDNGLAVILEAVQHPDRNIRLNTIKNLYAAPAYKKADFIRPVMEAIAKSIADDESIDVQREGIDALFGYAVKHFDRDFIRPVMLFALMHPSASVRSNGLKLAQVLYDETLIPILDEMAAEDADATVRERVIVLRSFMDESYSTHALVATVIRACLHDEHYWRDLANRCFRQFTNEEHGDQLHHALEHMRLEGRYGASIKRNIEKLIGPPEEFTPDAMIFKAAKIEVDNFTDMDTNWHYVEQAICNGDVRFYGIGHMLYMQSRRQRMEDLYKTVYQSAKSDKIRNQIEDDYKRVQGDIKRMER